jgi:hypothetical protein
MKVSETRRNLTIFMSPANVTNLTDCPISEEVICTLCRSVLYDPIYCKSCKARFCQECYVRFCEAVGNCPNNCETDKFAPITNTKLKRRLFKFNFKCIYERNGCEQIIPYGYAIQHEQSCLFKKLKCAAFRDCQRTLLRKDLNDHEITCPYFEINCEFCRISIPR